MVRPVKYELDTQEGVRFIRIEPVYEEIAGGDLFSTGRYLLTEDQLSGGEIRVDGDRYEWEWKGDRNLTASDIRQILSFIQNYNEPELACFLD